MSLTIVQFVGYFGFIENSWILNSELEIKIAYKWSTTS